MFNAQTLKAFAHGAAQGVALVSAAVAGSLIAAQILASAAKKD